MAIEQIFTDARSWVTLVSFATFVGIIWWTYGLRRKADFDSAANLPFADEPAGNETREAEKHHG
jgi:cytochrome c oxidase cbb3-type subunit 4